MVAEVIKMRKDENKRSSENETLNVKRFLRKRWVVPALYLIAAAGVLSSIFYFQGQGKDESAIREDGITVIEPLQEQSKPYDMDAVEVTSAAEVVQLPVEEESNVTIISQFYDVDGSEEEQQNALVYYDNTYFTNQGVDFAHVDGESFNVVASLSGTVTKAEKDSLLGYVIEISHDDEIVTHYHSLETIDVEVGSPVKQGDVLGQAGRNLYNEDAGVHVHFEIRKDGIPLNPNDVFQQSIDTIDVPAGEDEDDEQVERDEQDGEDDEKENKEERSSEGKDPEDGEEE